MKKNTEGTVDYAAELEKQERQKDVDCLNEVNAVLTKYKRSLVGNVSFIQGKNPVWGIQIVRNGKS